MSEQRPWTEEEVSCLGTKPDREVAAQLGRTEATVHAKRVAMGMAHTCPRLKRWTAEEDRLLGTAPDDEVAKQLGRTRVAVTARRCALGIDSANAKGPVLSADENLHAAAPDPEVVKELKPIEVPRAGLSQEDEERFKLLHGPYYPPRIERGKFLVCQWRGTVKVGGYSDAPIPWPYAFRTGYRSLILCGDLVRAVKLESEQAVAYHWKVSPTTVGKWRSILGVEQFNAGTMRLVWRSIEMARTPEAREKIAKAATGRVLSPEHRERLLAPNRRPKSEEFKRHLSDKTRERLAGGRIPKRWTPEEDARLGTMADRELAKLLGRSVGAVSSRRFLKRAGRLIDPGSFSWTAEQDQIVRTQRTREAARLLGRPAKVVRSRRRALGVRVVKSAAMHWTPEQDDIVRTHDAAQAAKVLGRSLSAVEKRRRRLDSPKPLSKPWTSEEIKLLGTKPDRMLARKFKRRTGSVQQKRWCLGIPSCSDKHIWRAADDNLLGKYPDEDVARFLKVSVGAVAMRRAKLGIAIKNPKFRPWTAEEEALLGTLPDEEVAKQSGRTLASVRNKRRKTGRPYSASRIEYWTADEDATVGTKRDEEVARALGRSVQAVHLRRLRLGIPAYRIGV